MRGRKPKTSEEKKASGNPGKRKLPKYRPSAPVGLIVCPKYFNDDEREIWNAALHNAPKDVIKPADVELLITYCEQVAIRRQAMRELKQQAHDNTSPDGRVSVMTVETERGWVKNPLITVLDTCAKNIRSLASELGLSPISRERLAQQPEREKSLKELLAGPAWDSTQTKPN